MKEPRVGIAAEGWPIILLCGLSAEVFAFAGCLPAAALFLLLTWFSCWFFRDPERVVPVTPGLAVSPADGKVTRIEKRRDPLSDEECQCISVFMNVFSVHVNRSPINGTVEDIKYYPGKFLNAAYDKASEENERCAYRVRDEEGRAFTMVQIAGLIARRIVCRTDIGDVLARGQRFGLIRFGSRVDLYLPQDYAPAVRIGDQVFAGQSVIANKV